MKRSVSFLFGLGVSLASLGQSDKSIHFASELTVSRHIDLKGDNLDLANVIDQFLLSKQESLAANRFWHKADFMRYEYPFIDIAWIDFDDSGKRAYKAQLLEIIDDVDGQSKIAKLAFVGIGSSNDLKAIFNLVARKEEGAYKLRRALDYNSRYWKKSNYGDIEYLISPSRIFSKTEAAEEDKYNKVLSDFFGVKIGKVTYYSCSNPVELFALKGFDYVHNMYLGRSGGLSEGFSKTIFSGNDTERYDHELVHLYTYTIYKGNINQFLNEGLATYLGGSNGKAYGFHKEELKRFLVANPDADLLGHMNPYDGVYLNAKTTLFSYVVGAVLCEIILKNGGKERLDQVLGMGSSEDSLWKGLGTVGIDRKNFSNRISEFVK